MDATGRSALDLRIVSLDAAPELAGTVAAWHWREWGPGDFGRTAEQWLETIRGRSRADGIPFTLVGLVGDTPVGTVSVCADDLDERYADRGPWVSGMVVVGRARNLGVGRALLAAAEARARAAGCHELWLHTAEAMRFYERCGWSLVAEKAALDRDAVLCRDLRAEARADG